MKRSERSVTALRQSWYGVATDALNYFWRRNVPVLSSVVRGLIDRLRLGGASLTDIRFFQPLLFHWGIAVTRERYDTGQREGAQRVDL